MVGLVWLTFMTSGLMMNNTKKQKFRCDDCGDPCFIELEGDNNNPTQCKLDQDIRCEWKVTNEPKTSKRGSK